MKKKKRNKSISMLFRNRKENVNCECGFLRRMKMSLWKLWGQGTSVFNIRIIELFDFHKHVGV